MQAHSHFEQHSYSGFEPSQAFDIVYGSHFEHRLLSPGRSNMSHLRLVVADVRIETGSYDFPVLGLGAMPADAVCIGFVADGADIVRYNAREIGDDEVQIYGPGAELMYHAGGPSRWVNFTASHATLQRIACERIGRPLRLPRRGIVSMRLMRGVRSHLRQVAGDAFALASSLHPQPIAEPLARAMSNVLIDAYIDALGDAEALAQPARTSTANRHHQLIRACERLALSSGLASISLAEMARRSGYSLRSLERIFRHGVGMPPDRYFLNLRLNGALRDLVAAGPSCSVTDVATRWGFRHLSRFAQQYKAAFGELPSQTLRRSLSR